MDKRYQIFISSTFSDLEEERKTVMDGILECNCFPSGMEMFPALEMEQFEYIKKKIDESDYYILVIAGKYGSLASDGISYTEKEYDYAVSKKIPVLAFIKKDIETIAAKNTDQNQEKKEQLLKFRKRVSEGRLVKFWDHKYELKNCIKDSLNSAFLQNPRIGWIRSDSVLEKENAQNIDVHEYINKPFGVNYCLGGGIEPKSVEIKLADVISVLGKDKYYQLDSNMYFLFVRDIIISNIKASTKSSLVDELKLLNFEISFDLDSINRKLETLNLVVFSSTHVPVNYVIALNENGKKCYTDLVLKNW